MKTVETVETGECPVCNGTGRMPTPDLIRKYAEKNNWYGYRKTDDRVKCTNCGGQYMYCSATGKVNLRPSGEPCVHEYESRPGRWSGVTEYKCVHCSDDYTIDSGD